ncbi:MAG: putative RNA-binding Zn-ribbon protein involved in translation (DUF1610 family) [Verrucomicrobiales bacterium]|jgi:predicted RNA-binding Zn-ribbon protein involved in translation (DUF1610 family)
MLPNDSSPPTGDAPEKSASRFLAALGFSDADIPLPEATAASPISETNERGEPQIPAGPPKIEPASAPLPESTRPKSAYPAAELDPRPAELDPFAVPTAPRSTAPAASAAGAPPFWLPNFAATAKGSSVVSPNSTSANSLGASFDAAPPEPTRNVPRPQQPARLQVAKVVCPSCHSELSISQAHLDVEGDCPTCGTAIVARQPADDPNGIRVDFASGSAPPPPPIAAPVPPQPVYSQPVAPAPVSVPVPAPAPASPHEKVLIQTPKTVEPTEAASEVVPQAVSPPSAAAAGPGFDTVPVLFGGLESESAVQEEPEMLVAEVISNPLLVSASPDFAPSEQPTPIEWSNESEEEAEPTHSPSILGGKLARDPLRLFAGVVLVLITSVLVVLAMYAPEFIDSPEPTVDGEKPQPEAVPAPKPPADRPDSRLHSSDTAPAEFAAVVPPPAPVRAPLRATPISIPPEGRTDEAFASPEPDSEPLRVIESVPAHDPNAETPAVVFANPNQPQRPETDAEIVSDATQVVESFLAADNIEGKLKWILDPEEHKANLRQFYAYEPLTTAPGPAIEYRSTEKSADDQPWVSVYDLKVQATLPHRILVVHPAEGAPKIDFALYRQMREGALHRYLSKSNGESATVSPQVFRVTLRRLAYRDVQDRIDSTLFHDPPLLFEVGLPFHEGSPVVVPISIDAPILEDLESVGWDEAMPALVELQWQPSESNPRQPVPSISRLISWDLW